MLWVFLIPFFVAEIFVAVNCFLWKPQKKGEVADKVPKKQPPIMFPLIPAAVQIVFFLLMMLIHKLAMAGYHEFMPRTVMVMICLFTDVAVFCEYWQLHERARKLTKQIAILCVGMFFIEFAGFNIKSFDTHYQQEDIPIQSMSEYAAAPEEGEEPVQHVFDDGDYLTVDTNETQIKIEDVPEWAGAVALGVEQDEKQRPILVRFYIADDNFMDAPQISGTKLVSTYEGDVAFSIAPYGKLRYIVTEVSMLTTPVRIYYATVMSSVPYRFSLIRYLVLFVICGLILLIREFNVQYMSYQSKSIWQNICLGLMTIACVATVFVYRNPDEENVSYPDGFEISEAEPYEQNFDAFQKGQIWLDLDVDEKLAEMGDAVYDRLSRDAVTTDYAWDRAYYKGKYYSYFGIVPVLVIYYPYYWMYHALPSLPTVCFIFSVPAILFLCLSLIAIVRIYVKNPNFLLLLASLPIATVLSGYYYFLNYPSMYNAPVAASLCFLFMAWCCGFWACLLKNPTLRLVLLFLAGVGCVGCVGSRPTVAPCIMMLAPAFVNILLNKEFKLNYRIAQAMGFLVPVMIGAAGLMYYNYIRFESPFDFGASYQLTVSNINANRIRISALPVAIYHYLIQLPVSKIVFPFFTYGTSFLDNYQMYSYIEKIIGAFAYPFLLMAVLLLPKAFKSHTLEGGATAGKLETRAFVILGYVFTVLILWADFCLGGVSVRYAQDFMEMLTIVSIIVVMNVIKPQRKYMYKGTFLCMLVTFVMVWLLQLHISLEGRVITKLPTVHPALQEILEDLFIFWE